MEQNQDENMVPVLQLCHSDPKFLEMLALFEKDLPGLVATDFFQLQNSVNYLERGRYFLDPLQTSEVIYEPRFIPPNRAKNLFNRFIKLDFERAHLTRSVIWFGPTNYSYGSGPNSTTLIWQSLVCNDDIFHLSQELSSYLKVSFNSCLVNLYENESQMVPKHSDDEPMFGEDPVIASLSFGAARRFIVEPKQDPHSLKLYRDTQHLKSIKSKYVFSLEDGDLIVMRGPMQRYFNHSVPREKFPCGVRINLTFRNVLIS